MSCEDKYCTCVHGLTQSMLEFASRYEPEDALAAGLSFMVALLKEHADGDAYENLINAAKALQIANNEHEVN